MNSAAQTHDRLSLLTQWLNSLAADNFSTPEPASSDASFRRYFRVWDRAAGKNRVVMDAPPDKEDCSSFIHITELLRTVGVNAPAIHAKDLSLGFLLLDDLGNQPYLGLLNKTSADSLYGDAIDALIKIQSINDDLPAYDAQKLQTEMDLFETWYLNKHLDIQLDASEKSGLAEIFNLLIRSATEQPQVFVHRDYHSRNLMKVENNNPGVIDYQDAVHGPITYDLVSLFKDCYIQWPRTQVKTWLKSYLAKSRLDVDFKTFLRWFDFMGVQRHLKVLGIFCRLYYRDAKSQYLNDLPLTLKYVIDTCQEYDELQTLYSLLDAHVLNHPTINKA